MSYRMQGNKSKNVKAKIGVKNKFNTTKDKKSIIIIPFKLVFLPIDM